MGGVAPRQTLLVRASSKPGRWGSSGRVSASRIARRSQGSCLATSRRSRSTARSPSRTAASRRRRAISASPGGALGRPNVDDALLGGHLGAQRPKLSFVFSGRLAQNDRCTPVRSISRACRILSASLAALSGPRLTSEGLLNVDEGACLRGRRPLTAHGGPPGTRARRRPRVQTPGEHHARPSTPVWRFRLRRSGSLRRRPVHDRCGRRAGAQVETSAPRRMEQSAGTLADGHLAAGMDESEQRRAGRAARRPLLGFAHCDTDFAPLISRHPHQLSLPIDGMPPLLGSSRGRRISLVSAMSRLRTDGRAARRGRLSLG
jgi:hypothetical protein